MSDGDESDACACGCDVCEAIYRTQDEVLRRRRRILVFLLQKIHKELAHRQPQACPHMLIALFILPGEKGRSHLLQGVQRSAEETAVGTLILI